MKFKIIIIIIIIIRESNFLLYISYYHMYIFGFILSYSGSIHL